MTRLISILLAPTRLHPLALGACGLAGLIASILMLPIDWDSPSDTGRVIHRLLHGPVSADVNFGTPPVCGIAKTDGEWVVVSVHDLVLRHIPSTHTIRPRAWSNRAGLFGLTRVEHEASLTILDANYNIAALPDDEAKAIRAATVAALQQRFPEAYDRYYFRTRNAVEYGRWQGATPRLAGWLHNTAALLSLAALFTAFIHGCACLRRLWRTRSGGCPSCGYPTAGLPAAACCPECGQYPQIAASNN